MATCPACGKEYTPPAAFCPTCNAVLDKPDAPAALPPTAGQAPPGARALPAAPILAPARPAPVFGDIGAYFVRRLLALIVDIAGVGLLIAIGLLALFERINTNIHPQTADGYRTFLIVVGCALFLYFWLFEGLVSTTLGKLLFGLGVVRDAGDRPGLGRAFVRNLLRAVDLAGVGFILAALTSRRKRIGDMLGGTMVVSHRMGALAPVVAIVGLGGIGYLAYAYGDAFGKTRALVNSTQQFAPILFAPNAPPPLVSPMPSGTAAPTPSPMASPSGASIPSGAAASPTP